MLDLSEFFSQKPKSHKADISLSGWLEAFVGSYFVRGEGGGNRNFHWLSVYYDPDTDPLYEAVETIGANLVAYVSSDYRWSFVLSSHLEKFQKDTAKYGMAYLAAPNFEQELLKCSRTDLLPQALSDILWIDDDFMDDENIPFDYDSFSLIDDGVDYLNPKHFSVTQLMRIVGDKF